VTDLAQLPEGAVHFADGQAVALIAPRAGLTALPDSIGELTTLRRIDLDGNALTHLPAGIAALRRLQTLLLYRNRLTEIPDSIGDLVQLRMLDPGHNQLRRIPDSILLTHLDLRASQLRQLPDSLALLPRLEKFDRRWAKLDRIPNWIDRLRRRGRAVLQ
jgi:Leucine-rich repeat (LRR) protein